MYEKCITTSYMMMSKELPRLIQFKICIKIKWRGQRSSRARHVLNMIQQFWNFYIKSLLHNRLQCSEIIVMAQLLCMKCSKLLYSSTSWTISRESCGFAMVIKLNYHVFFNICKPLHSELGITISETNSLLDIYILFKIRGILLRYTNWTIC